MRPPSHRHSAGNTARHRQQGLATLAFTVALLALLTLVALQGARLALQERRHGTAAFQQAQALWAAQAGLAQARARLELEARMGVVQPRGRWRGTLPDGSAYEVRWEIHPAPASASTPLIGPAIPRQVALRARGRSADGSRSHGLHHRLLIQPQASDPTALHVRPLPGGWIDGPFEREDMP